MPSLLRISWISRGWTLATEPSSEVPAVLLVGGLVATPSFPQSPFLGKVREEHGQLLQASWCQVTVSSDAPVNLPNERYSLF